MRGPGRLRCTATPAAQLGLACHRAALLPAAVPVPPRQPHGLTRRQFVRSATGGLGLLLATGTVRGLATACSGFQVRSTPNVLVLIQLSGGNDGLNTVIPLQDENYRRLRPTLALAPAQTLRLDEHHGLHPACAGLHELYQRGKITLLPHVSAAPTAGGHFAAGELWARGQVRPDDDTGWLGRWLDQGQSNAAWSEDPSAIYFGQHLPPALRSRQPHRLAQIDPADACAPRSNRLRSNSPHGSPDGLFGRSLDRVVDLLRQHPGTRLHCLTLGGFDTHRNQAQQHAKLLRTLSEGLSAYQQNLESHGLADRVLTMVWSEFGRQPAENAVRGTDHGTTGPVVLLGNRANAGIVGQTMTASPEPSAATDFRQIYATLLEDWLASPAHAVLDRQWAKLPLVRNDPAYLPMP